MAMEFEQAIQNAQTLFLFDRRSQRQLQEMAEEAPARSRDRYLIQLTMAAFAYYNATDGQAADLRKIIQQAQGVLREVKQFREDRVFFTLALRMEVDLLMRLSALAYQEAEPADRAKRVYNEEDGRALSICETLLKNFPPSFDPLPSNWYSGVIPLFPPYRDEVVLFYRDRVQEHPSSRRCREVGGEIAHGHAGDERDVRRKERQHTRGQEGEDAGAERDQHSQRAIHQRAIASTSECAASLSQWRGPMARAASVPLRSTMKLEGSARTPYVFASPIVGSSATRKVNWCRARNGFTTPAAASTDTATISKPASLCCR